MMLPETGLNFCSGIIRRKFAERSTALRKEACDRHKDIKTILQRHKEGYIHSRSDFHTRAQTRGTFFSTDRTWRKRNFELHKDLDHFAACLKFNRSKILKVSHFKKMELPNRFSSSEEKKIEKQMTLRFLIERLLNKSNSIFLPSFFKSTYCFVFHTNMYTEEFILVKTFHWL